MLADRPQERTLISLLAANGVPREFHPPSLDEFFPEALLFAGTPFEINRIILIRIIMTIVVCAFFIAAFRSPKIVPRGLQNVAEVAFDFVRVQIGEEILGKANGRRFLPLLAAIFFAVLAMNITGVIPLLNISPNSLVGFPLVLAVVVYVTFIYAGIKAQGTGAFFKNSLVLPGVPPAFHALLVPIEFLSTFIMRPVSLTIRLLANMLAGHLMMVLFFGATNYLLLEAAGFLKIASVGSFLMGLFIYAIEMFVAVLQAYIFSLLAAVYISLAVEAEH